MHARMVVFGWALTMLVPAPLVAHVDGMSLSVSRGVLPGEVRLEWTGGQPSYQVYRADRAAGIISPEHLLGSSEVRSWSDMPGPETMDFYMITSSCLYNPPETCDGQDNNCDGLIDEPGSEISCNDGNGCSTDTCVAGACLHIDQRACPAAPTSGEAGVSCAQSPSTGGCWGTSCSTEIVALPPDCSNPDDDGDGLNNTWESNGWIDLDCNGYLDPNDVSLPDSSPVVKDVYLKISWMASTPVEPFPELHRPTSEAVERLVAMFAGAHLKTEPQRCNPTLPCDPGSVCSGSDFICLPACVTDADCLSTTDGGVCAGGMCRRRRLHLSTAEMNMIPHTRVVTFGPVSEACITGGSGGNPSVARNFYDIKAENFNPKESLFKRYGIFGHFQSCDSAATCADPGCPSAEGSRPDFTNSGLAESVGNDAIVSLGALDIFLYTSDKDRRDAVSTAHELGHNLGLHHGGPKCDPPTDPGCPDDWDRDRKPHHISVMNYTYQFGIPLASVPGSTTPGPGWALDYSHVELPLLGLDENNLNEPMGVDPGNPPPWDRYLVRFPNPVTGGFSYGSTMPGMPIDWNSDGTLDPALVFDLDGNGLLEILDGANDWDHLRYGFQCTEAFQD